MNTSFSSTKLRSASKNERRYIMRHALGWYRSLVIAGLYTVDKNAAFDMSSIESYIPALKWCIHNHPILSAAIENEGSETPEFIRPRELNLANHIEIKDSKSLRSNTTDDRELLKLVTLEAHDKPWDNVYRIPQWKVVVVPLPEQADPSAKRAYILYVYSHTHGDGKSGLAFHRSFLQGLQTAKHRYNQDLIYNPPVTPLPPSLEEACDLRVSWSYLLSPLLGQYLPRFASRWLNLQSAVTPESTNAYIGKPTVYDPGNFRTGSQHLVVDNSLINKILTACRSHNAKFTGLLNQLIVRALSDILPGTEAQSLIGQIVVDLRSLIPAYSDNTMGNCASAVYETSKKIDPGAKYDEVFWNAVRETTSRLAYAANTLDDQPVGLLRYLNNFRSWFLEKLGKERDTSYEISNVGVFDPSLPRSENPSQQEEESWKIERILFSQPANVTASPLNFQVVTMKGGEMVITLNWQVGVLGVSYENVAAAEVLGRVNYLLHELS